MSAKDFSDTKPMATNFYEAAIGERNQSYYLSKFENFDAQGPGLHASWNWAAFFFTGFWALYRKMYGWFVVWIVVVMFFGIIEKAASKSSTGASWTLVVNLLIGIGFAVYANSFYHHKVKARIAAAQKSKPKAFGLDQGQTFSDRQSPGNDAYATALAEIEEGRLDKGIWARAFAESGGDESKAKAAYIKARAGAFQNAGADATQQDTDSNTTANGITSGVNMWVPIGLGGLVLLGIVAAIALPAYQDRTKQRAVVESPVQAPASTAQSEKKTFTYEEAFQTPAPTQQKPWEMYALFEEGMTAYKNKDYAGALAKWRPLAEQGMVDAQFRLGVMHAGGHGVQQNDAEAVSWWRKAAEQGYADAQSNLGMSYLDGRGVPNNDAEAVRWFRKAADQGFASALNNLGACYLLGRGVPRDYAQAMHWYRKAAEQGNSVAQYNLGLMYASELENDTEAVRWYRKAAAQGFAGAQQELQKRGLQ